MSTPNALTLLTEWANPLCNTLFDRMPNLEPEVWQRMVAKERADRAAWREGKKET